MILTEHKIWQLPLMLLLTLWLGACSSYLDEEIVEGPDDSSNLSLILSISTGDRSRSFSRADVEFENPVDDRERMNTLRIIIVKQADGKVAHNESVVLDQPAVFKDGLKYRVEFDTDYTIYIVANEGGLPTATQNLLKGIAPYGVVEASTLENIVIASSEAGAPMIDDATTPVPITEIFNIKTVKAENATPLPEDNEIVQKESFFITRTATKFSFHFFRGTEFDGITPGENDNSLKNWSITDIKLTGLGFKEYLFPKDTEYTPAKYTASGAVNDPGNSKRDIIEFSLPADGNGIGDRVFTLPAALHVMDLPIRPANFDSSSPTAGLSSEQIANSVYSPLIYFPESKGEGGSGTENGVGMFGCSIRYNDNEGFTTDDAGFLTPQIFDNLPNGLPRNTHVVVIVTIKPTKIECVVDVIPFTGVELKPDYGLERDEYTGYIKGKDEDGNLCWWDDSSHAGLAGPYYLGPKNNVDEFVNINGEDYMLVYADYADWTGFSAPGYDRSAITLNHVIDSTGKKFFLTVESITGYEGVMDTPNPWLAFYINDLKQRVWVEDNISPYCRTLNEWDRLEYNGPGNGWPDYLYCIPRYWFDILGNRYKCPVMEHEIDESVEIFRKRYFDKLNNEKAVILGDWVNYLSDIETNP